MEKPMIKKGMYQVKRIKADCRDSNANNAEITLNSVLIELQQDSNIEIIDVIDTTSDKSVFTFIIKYYDYGLNS